MTPSHASATRKGGGEALTGGLQAWLTSSEITDSSADLVQRWGRQYWCAAIARGAHQTRGVRDSEHASKLFARKPGGPATGHEKMVRMENPQGYGHDERAQGVGQLRSIVEAFEHGL